MDPGSQEEVDRSSLRHNVVGSDQQENHDLKYIPKLIYDI